MIHFPVCACAMKYLGSFLRQFRDNLVLLSLSSLDVNTTSGTTTQINSNGNATLIGAIAFAFHEFITRKQLFMNSSPESSFS